MMNDMKIIDPASIPLYFTDKILSVANSDDTVKLYLARVDPGVEGLVNSATTVSAQVVMPMRTFVDTLAFFTAVFESMKKQGIVTQEELEAALKAQEIHDE